MTTTQPELEKFVEEEIEQARSELTTVVLAKQKEIICRMGEALEKIRKGEKRHSICEELKNRLREEIARRIITEKTIENHCRPEWKDPQKSRWGKKGATSKNRLSSSSPAEKLSASLESGEERQGDHDKSDQQRDQAILVNANRSIDCTTDLNSNGLAALTTSNDSSQYEKQSHEFAKPSSAQTAKATFPSAKSSSPEYLEFEFWLPFDEVEEEMKRRFAKQGNTAKMWFNGIIDASTGKVFTANVGRIKEPHDENELSDMVNHMVDDNDTS